MKCLLDTHTVLWAVDQDEHLGPAARAAILDETNELLFSYVSIWEIAIKVGLDRLTLEVPFRHWVAQAIDDLKLKTLQIGLEHAMQYTLLPFHHRDPFDRMLIAQAISESVPIISADDWLDQYEITRIWK